MPELAARNPALQLQGLPGKEESEVTAKQRRDAAIDKSVSALGKLGRTRSGMKLIKDHSAALLGLIFDEWRGFNPRPPLLIRMHLKAEDLDR